MKLAWQPLVCVTAALVGIGFMVPPVFTMASSVWSTARSSGQELMTGLLLVVTALFNWAHARSRIGHCWSLRIGNLLLGAALVYLSTRPSSPLQWWLEIIAAALVLLLVIPSFRRPRATVAPPKGESPLNVVFVHGILGTDQTWGRFPELLSADSELPVLKVDVWTYHTVGCVCDNPIATIAAMLRTRLGGAAAMPNARFYLVGHSMGGLVILKMLVDELKDRRGQRAPAANVAMVSLFATPCYGAVAANIVNSLWPRRLFLHRLSPQVRELTKGDFTSELMSDVQNLIYRPNETGPSHRKIPIHITVGAQDPWVRHVDAKAFFKEPPPQYLEHDHASVKEPQDADDERYTGFRRDLDEDLAPWFRGICQDCFSADPHVHDRGMELFDALYRPKLAARIKDALGPARLELFPGIMDAIRYAGANQATVLPPSVVIRSVLRRVLQ